jgi:tRNA1(Val) A37 N6-methylase TrmN6
LGGCILAEQPRDGFRAGHDTVLLAAAVPGGAGDSVLELGSGAGIASLCLAWRVPEIRILGTEIDADLVRIAGENAARNGMAGRVRFMTADVLSSNTAELFHHVFFNPPFHPDTGQISPNSARDSAKRDVQDCVVQWTRAALALVKPEGTVTAIARADRVEELLAEATGHMATVFPLYPRAGETPKRAIVRIVKGREARLRCAAGLILHESDGRNTGEAEAVLRHAAALDLD